MSRLGGSGYGVGTRMRSVSALPFASSARAFKPLPPMSIASVIGPDRLAGVMVGG